MTRRDEREDLARDARRELWLVPKALLSIAVVAAIVLVREFILR